MEIEKTLLLSTADNLKVDIITSKLQNEGIPTWIINKKDSMYMTFGHIEVYVQKNHFSRAQELIETED